MKKYERNLWGPDNGTGGRRGWGRNSARPPVCFLKTAKQPVKNAGSNFTVKGKKFEWLAKGGYKIIAENPQCTMWLAYRDSFRKFIKNEGLQMETVPYNF